MAIVVANEIRWCRDAIHSTLKSVSGKQFHYFDLRFTLDFRVSVGTSSLFYDHRLKLKHMIGGMNLVNPPPYLLAGMICRTTTTSWSEDDGDDAAAGLMKIIIIIINHVVDYWYHDIAVMITIFIRLKVPVMWQIHYWKLVLLGQATGVWGGRGSCLPWGLGHAHAVVMIELIILINS